MRYKPNSLNRKAAIATDLILNCLFVLFALGMVAYGIHQVFGDKADAAVKVVVKLMSFPFLGLILGLLLRWRYTRGNNRR